MYVPAALLGLIFQVLNFHLPLYSSVPALRGYGGHHLFAEVALKEY
jgi:hypothetical protein